MIRSVDLMGALLITVRVFGNRTTKSAISIHKSQRMLQKSKRWMNVWQRILKRAAGRKSITNPLPAKERTGFQKMKNPALLRLPGRRRVKGSIFQVSEVA